MTDLTIPVPLEPLEEENEDKRLWVGNLDPRITDLVKLLQTYGSLKKFDMLYHRSGPLEGQPRGYAFVTYTSKEIAETAKACLDGVLVGNKNICVKWAHSIPKSENEKQRTFPEILALGGTKEMKNSSRSTTIKAIEAKLKTMESASYVSDFKITDKPSISQRVFVKSEQITSSKKKFVTRTKIKPYSKTN